MKFLWIFTSLLLLLDSFLLANSQKEHRVQKGDTWYGIARKYQIRPGELAEQNGRSLEEPLFLGEALRLPWVNPLERKENTIQEGYSFPLIQRVSVAKRFSNVSWEPHKGILFAKGKSSAVRAIQSGKVLSVDFLDGYENVVILEHKQGIYSVYGNLEKILVQEGQTVSAKERLGSLVKDKGLYFQTNKQKQILDPMKVLGLDH